MFNCFNEDELVQKNGVSATVSMGDWFKLMLISLFSCIPVVGFLITLVVYIIVAFKRETSPSIANYLKVSLLLSAIVMAIFLAITLFFFFMGLSVLP